MIANARKMTAAAAAALALAACQTGPTPYQSGDANAPGYSDSRIETDRYRVSFRGNSLTDRETVETYLLYRAAELTLENGYDAFTIVSRDTDTTRRYVSSGGSPFSSRFSYAYFSPRYGWIGAWDPFWTPTTVSEVKRYEASAEIRLGKGPKGDDPNAFDARDVTRNLSGKITRPSP